METPPATASFAARTALPFAVAILALLGLAILAGHILTDMVAVTDARKQAREGLLQAERALSLLKDAETAERGYIITGQEAFLEPYRAAERGMTAVDGKLTRLGQANPGLGRDFARLRPMIQRQMVLLADNIELRRRQGEMAAKAQVEGGDVKAGMDRIRAEVARTTRTLENDIAALQRRLGSLQRLGSLLVLGLGALTPLILVAAFWRIQREHRGRMRAEAAAHAAALAREQEFQKIQAQLRIAASLERAGLGFLALARDGRCLDLNAEASHLLDRQREAMVGEPLWPCLPTEAGPAVRAALERVVQTQRPETLEVHSEAPERWLEYRLYPSEEGVAIYLSELTERRRAELLASQRNAELASVFEALPDLYFRMGRDGRILDYRAQAISDLYLPPEHFLGQRMQDLLPPEAGRLFNDHIAAALAADKPDCHTFEYSLPMPAGDRHFEARLSALPGRAEVVAVVRDISDRYAAQASIRKWADAFQHCAHGIALGNARTNRLMACNPALGTLLGWPPEELVDRPILEIYAPAERDQLRQRIALVDQLGEIRYEAQMLRRDGSTLPVQLDLVSVRGPDGEPLYRVATIQDIRDRRQAEQALRQARDDLRAFARRLDRDIEQERRRLAREVHDQLGQLFTALKILVTRLAGRSAEPSAIEAGLRETSQLLDEGVQISRRLAAELRPAVLDDLGLTAAVEVLAQGFAAKTGLACQVSMTEDPRLDAAASLQLYRLIQEALTNVARHAGAHRVEIRGAPQDGRYLLSVDDDGRGLAAPPPQGSFGLTSMTERAELIGAAFQLLPSPLGGVRVEVTLPLQGRAEP
jgi:PAS domain S-box-containing protein